VPGSCCSCDRGTQALAAWAELRRWPGPGVCPCAASPVPSSTRWRAPAGASRTARRAWISPRSPPTRTPRTPFRLAMPKHRPRVDRAVPEIQSQPRRHWDTTFRPFAVSDAGKSATRCRNSRATRPCRRSILREAGGLSSFSISSPPGTLETVRKMLPAMFDVGSDQLRMARRPLAALDFEIKGQTSCASASSWRRATSGTSSPPWPSLPN